MLHLLPYWWVLPLGGVIIGWVVNYIGIAMIFEPIHWRRWVPWHQGLLIKRQPEVTELYAQMVSEKVITLQNIGDGTAQRAAQRPHHADAARQPAARGRQGGRAGARSGAARYRDA